MENLLSLIPFIIVWLVVLVFFWVNKIWVFHFFWGCIGFSLLAIFLLTNTPFELRLSNTAIGLISSINQGLGVPIKPFAKVGVILMTNNPIYGYTALEIGTECSGLLEIAVFWGLSLFYPALNIYRKAAYLGMGTLIIYFLNLIRVELIISCVFWGGRDTIYFAHTILGRGVFFILMIALYWLFFTRPTMQFLKRQA